MWCITNRIPPLWQMSRRPYTLQLWDFTLQYKISIWNILVSVWRSDKAMMRCQLSENRRKISLTTLQMFLIFLSDFAISNNLSALMVILFVPTCFVSTISMLLTFSALLLIPSCVLLFAIFPRSIFAAFISLFLSHTQTHTPGINGCYLIASFYRPPLNTKHKQKHALTYTGICMHTCVHTRTHTKGCTCAHKQHFK